MKRLLSVMLVVTMLLTLFAGASADSPTGTNTNHKHEWIQSSKQDATCTEKGWVIEYCRCGEQRSREIPAKGHHYNPDKWTVRHEPTCTEKGQEKNMCTRCGYTWYRDLEPLGHDWSEWYVVKAPTASEPGLEERKCNRCGITEQRPCYLSENEPSVTLNAYIPDPQPTYGEGENIPYMLEVTNNSDIPLYIMWIYYYEPDGSNGYVTGLWHKPIGAHETIYESGFSIQINKNDLETFAPTYTVKFEVDAYKSESDYGNYANSVANNGWVHVSANIGDEIAKPEGALLLSKSEASTPENGAYYVEGEEVTFAVTVENGGEGDLYDVRVMEYPSGWTGWETDYYSLASYEVMPAGYSESFTVKYTVKAEDCEKGSYTNLAQAVAYAQKDVKDNRIDVAAEATVDTGFGDEDEEIGDMELYITKTEVSTPANGSYYTQDEIITYEIEYWNCQSWELKNVMVYDDPSDGESVLLASQATFGPHRVEKCTYSHQVTAADCEKGVYINNSHATWESPNDTAEDLEEFGPNLIDSGEVESPCGGAGDVTITKTVISTPANGEYYVEGEEIQYKVECTIAPGKTLHGAVLHDTMVPETKLNPPSGLGDVTEFLSATYSYTVTAEDAMSGEVINTAFIDWFEDDGTPNSAYSGTVITLTGMTVDKRGVTLEKRVISTPENGLYYVEDEIIYYEIVVYNDFNETVYDVEIVDPIKGSNEDSVVAIIPELAPKDSAAYVITHRVTAEDVLDQWVLNQATGSYSDGLNQFNISSNIVSVPTGGYDPIPLPSVLLVKYVYTDPANGAYYVEGETVTYGFYVYNANDYEIKNVSVFDPLYGSGSIGSWGSVPANFETLEGEDKRFDHVVTKEEAEAGSIVNQGYCTYTIPGDPSTYTVASDTVTVPTGVFVPEDVSLSISKTVVSAPADGMAYKEGETISYLITIVNSSDYEAWIDTAEDHLYTSLYSEAVEIANTIKIAPHDIWSIPFSHTVNKDDVEAGYVVNEAIANMYVFFTDEDFRYFYLFDSVRVPCAPGEPEIVKEYPAVVKYVVSSPKNGAYYTENEVVEYVIVVNNHTGRVFYDIKGYDILLDTPGYYFGGMATLDASPASFHVSYTVTNVDVGVGSIYNIAWVEMFDALGDENITIYSNEVVVPTKDGVAAPKGNDHCEYSITAAGEGAMSFMNVYCSEHAGVEMATKKLMEDAASDAEIAKAKELQLGLWQNAMDREYERLIKNASSDTLATALTGDQRMFTAYLKARRDTLTTQGVSANDINDELTLLIRDRVCELCCTDATAPEERLDIQNEQTPAMQRIVGNTCTFTFDTKNEAWFNKNISVCEKHMMLWNAASRVLAAAQSDASLTESVWLKARTYWDSEIGGLFERLGAEGNPLMKHMCAVEQASFRAAVDARKALYEAYYPDQPAVVGELTARMALEKVTALHK